jgi:hypothetical protein
MKVLQQLIQYFWKRGALTADQAHYLVEHGFIRPGELENYQARAQPLEDETAAAESLRELDLLPPDELDHAEDALEHRPPGKRRAGKGSAKPTEFTGEQLSADLRPELSLRALYFPALIELAQPLDSPSDFENAAIALRQLDAERFRDLVMDATHSRPALLRELWCAVESRAFHDLLEDVHCRGRVAMAYRAILNAATPAAWGHYAWILHVPEVQTVANLLAVRRHLLGTLSWMLDNSWPRLTKCIQAPRGRRACAAWDVAFLGLVLAVNARDFARNLKRAGYSYKRWHAPGTWCEAWTTALLLEPTATQYTIHLYGSVAAASAAETPSLSEREDVEIVCPYDWKI